jgi:hypothetical protein
VTAHNFLGANNQQTEERGTPLDGLEGDLGARISPGENCRCRCKHLEAALWQIKQDQFHPAFALGKTCNKRVKLPENIRRVGKCSWDICMVQGEEVLIPLNEVSLSATSDQQSLQTEDSIAKARLNASF